jgi:flagellar basal-body rod modification protein FlgD
MDISLVMSPQDLATVTREVDAYNKKLADGKTTKAGGDMGKDEFLKILITQLSHQDPTQPMEDKEFISQMAQFSSLEQMSNMSLGMAKVADLLARSQALSILGSFVDVEDGSNTVSGLVQEVTGGSFPQILVNGQYYDFSQVKSVRTNTKE